MLEKILRKFDFFIWVLLTRNPPINPITINACAKPSFGIKKAPMTIPIKINILIPQKPFWIFARKSFDDLTLIIFNDHIRIEIVYFSTVIYLRAKKAERRKSSYQMRDDKLPKSQLFSSNQLMELMESLESVNSLILNQYKVLESWSMYFRDQELTWYRM